MASVPTLQIQRLLVDRVLTKKPNAMPTLQQRGKLLDKQKTYSSCPTHREEQEQMAAVELMSY
jgi:hypothetical protein